MQWTTACPDWEQRIVARQSLIPFAPLFPEEAAEALRIFKQLRVPDLPGKPTFGECAPQWVFDLVSVVFGSYDPATEVQLIREFLVLISKKNFKSTVAAGIMLTALILCLRDEEEHLILAPTKEVADNSYRPSAGMVRADSELADRFHIQDHVRTITDRTNNSSLKVVAADTDTVSGKKAGRILIDEHWLFGKKANADAMLMEATGGQISRPEGWVIKLTTQSDDPPAGVFKADLDLYRDIRDGRASNPQKLGILYEFPPAMLKNKAYLHPENFYVTNPSIGEGGKQWIASKLAELKNLQDGSFQKFIAKHLNIEIGLGLRSDRWAGADFWEKGASLVTLDTLIARCDVITAGVDGGGLDDMLALAFIGRDRDTGDWLLWVHAWIHPIVLERRKAEASRFRDFERDGDLTIVELIGQDVEQVADYIKRMDDSSLLDKIGVDQAGIGAIVEAIVEREIAEDRIVGIPQGWRLVGAIKTTERKCAEGALKHSGSALMTWCVGNAKVEPRGNAILITKQQAGSAKIDPLMATFNAVALMSMNPQSSKSFWE